MSRLRILLPLAGDNPRSSPFLEALAQGVAEVLGMGLVLRSMVCAGPCVPKAPGRVGPGLPDIGGPPLLYPGRALMLLLGQFRHPPAPPPPVAVRTGPRPPPAGPACGGRCLVPRCSPSSSSYSGVVLNEFATVAGGFFLGVRGLGTLDAGGVPF